MSTPGVPLTGADAENPSPLPEEEVVIDLQKLWDKYEKDPNFFKAIELAKDGGMSEASELIGTGRYISAVLPVVFVLLNIYSLYVVNLGFLFFNQEGGDTSPIKVFMITQNYILLPLKFTDFTAAQVIASIEVLLITWYILRMVYWAFFIRFPGQHIMHRWQAVQEFFWNAVPECSTISSVKMLNFVTPSVVVPDLLETISTSGARLPLNIVLFLFTRVIALIIGFDSLLFKLQTNTGAIALDCNKLDDNDDGTNNFECNFTIFGTGVLCITFLNQILGIVQVGWFVRKRIFQFIFAGEDGVMSAQEEALKETWESMLAERIWRELSWHQAIAAYLTYSDYDFQKLALETVTDTNADRVASKAEKKQMRAQRSAEMESRTVQEGGVQLTEQQS